MYNVGGPIHNHLHSDEDTYMSTPPDGATAEDGRTATDDVRVQHLAGPCSHLTHTTTGL